MDDVMVVEADALERDEESGFPESRVMTPRRTEDGRPDPQWVRGRCPECGDDLISNLYYIGGKGYVIRWECWGSLQENPQCHYKRVL